MREASGTTADWASLRRRRWSASRIAAALALHVLVLASLRLAIDRVELPRHGPERSTTLVMVALHPMAPVAHALPPARVATPAPTRSLLHATAPGAPTRANAHAHAQAQAPAEAPLRPREDATQAITLPAAPHGEPEVAAVTAPASSPRADLAFLDNAATRDAIRAVARGDTLRRQGNALTDEASGSELVAADGSHTGMTRHLAPPPPAVALAQGVDAAHKGDCMKGDFIGGGMGLLSAPFLLAAEALGKCAQKL